MLLALSAPALALAHSGRGSSAPFLMASSGGASLLPPLPAMVPANSGRGASLLPRASATVSPHPRAAKVPKKPLPLPSPILEQLDKAVPTTCRGSRKDGAPSPREAAPSGGTTAPGAAPAFHEFRSVVDPALAVFQSRSFLRPPPSPTLLR